MCFYWIRYGPVRNWKGYDFASHWVIERAQITWSLVSLEFNDQLNHRIINFCDRREQMTNKTTRKK